MTVRRIAELLAFLCTFVQGVQAAWQITDRYRDNHKAKISGALVGKSIPPLAIFSFVTAAVTAVVGFWLIFHSPKNMAMGSPIQPSATNLGNSPSNAAPPGLPPPRVVNPLFVNPPHHTPQAQPPIASTLPPQQTGAVNCGSAGNCAGINNGTQQINQYGARPLEMTDEQRDAITGAMRPYAGISIQVNCQRGLDTEPYTEKLISALRSAGIVVTNSTCAYILGDVLGTIHPGVQVNYSLDRVRVVSALAQVMHDKGLIEGLPVREVRDAEGVITVFVTPNR